MNLIYAQMFVFSREWMYLRTIGRRFTQMIAYFLVMNSKRCTENEPLKSFFLFFFVLQDDPDRTASVIHDNLYWTGNTNSVRMLNNKSVNLNNSSASLFGTVVVKFTTHQLAYWRCLVILPCYPYLLFLFCMKYWKVKFDLSHRINQGHPTTECFQIRQTFL